MTSDFRRHVLLDTNVLICAVDAREQSKARIVATVVERAVSAGLAVVSPQVIAEFFDATTRRRGGVPPLFTRAQAAAAAYDILAGCRCIDLTAVTVAAAIDAALDFQMRVFDAQIWAVARLNGVTTIISEDTPSRPVIQGVRYVDPFAPGFRMDQIGL